MRVCLDHKCMICLLFFAFPCLGSSSLSSYESVRALDQYGNAVQLKHAQAAADVQGRLVIAINRSEETWIVSIPSVHKHQKQQRGIVHLLHHPQQSCQAIVCTGIQADAQWLVRQLQVYSSRLWDRYDQYGSESMAQAVAFLKRRFWGYNEKEAYQGTAWSASQNDDQWARPIGVRTMVVSSRPPRLQLVEPSGILRRFDTVCCMGKYSQEVQVKLMDRLTSQTEDTLDDESLQKLIIDVLSSTLGSKPSRLLIEVVSKDGVEQRDVAFEP